MPGPVPPWRRLMWRVTLRGVAGHSLRYALTALAVLLGVAFMASTLVLTDTIGHTFDRLYQQHLPVDYRGGARRAGL